MSLLFQPEHIAAIRPGEKTATQRDWADNYNFPTPVSVQMAVTELFTNDDECDCYIKIEDVYRHHLAQ